MTWAAVPSAAPTLREIMEAEAKAERNQRSQLSSSFSAAAAVPEQRSGWGPWAASTNAKVRHNKKKEEDANFFFFGIEFA